MIHKSEIKLITSLQQKKYRQEHGLFVAEGMKLVQDLIDSGHQPVYLLATDEVTIAHKDARIVSNRELQKMSGLKNASGVLGVFNIPKQQSPNSIGLIVVLDAIRDPGNLGTIIRLCDWFGVSHLVCSEDTVDCYNPKVVQASMGSIARVPISYLNLETFLEKTTLPVFAAVMDGRSVYHESLPQNAMLVMGNEGKGISEQLLGKISNSIAIPSFRDGGAESLNVAMATGILLSEFRRGTIEK